MGGKTKAEKLELSRVRKEGYEAGYRDGLKAGRAAAEKEQAELDARRAVDGSGPGLDLSRRMVPIPGRPPDAPPDVKGGAR